jgi:hypothetical protein
MTPACATVRILEDHSMPETTLATKLKLKAGQRAAVLHAPDGYLTALQLTNYVIAQTMISGQL